MNRPRKTNAVRKSSGNVFKDIGMSNASDALVKAQLAHEICAVIAARRLNQTEAGRLIGLDQPKISALKRGQLRGFSADRLLRCLNDLGREVDIVIRPASRKRGMVRVLVAGR